MVQEPQLDILTSAWTNPDVLMDLLDYFRNEAGYNVTPNEYALAQDLVLGLIARGEKVDDNALLGKYLAPVLCSTPTEQANFSAHFARWSRTQVAAVPREPQEKAVERKVEIEAQRWHHWRWILATIAICVALTSILFWWSYIHVSSSPVAGPGPVVVPRVGTKAPQAGSRVLFGVLGGTGLALFLTVISWGMWWYLRGRLFLKRLTTSEEPDLISVKLNSRMDEYLDHTFLKRAARELRRRYTVISSELAIVPTVEQTARNNGQFTPVLGSRQLAPEYLVLIDRKSFRDHNARYIDEILDRLRADQVYIQRYYFDADPRTIMPPSKHDPPLTIGELKTKYREFRVLLFTDATGLFNPVSAEIEPWVESVWCWPHMAVLTPKPRETWGFQEAQLAQRALVMTAAPESIITFAQQIAGARLSPRSHFYAGAPLPAELVERPMRWLGRNAPETEIVDDVLESVRLFLGEEVYLWLSSCSVYPEVHFNLTLYIGTNLRNAEGEPLFNTERLTTLFRLPWLKYAYIPDWLRLRLVAPLSQEQSTNIREVLNRLWLSVASGSTEAIDLQIARKHTLAVTTLAKSVYRKLARKSPPHSPLRDTVFASVMLGSNLEPLSVRVPSMWRELLKGRGDSATTVEGSSKADVQITGNHVLRCKSIDKLISEAENPEYRLRRSLGPWSLTMLGIGAIIGSGIFVLAGTAAAGEQFQSPSILHAQVLDVIMNFLRTGGAGALHSRPPAGPAIVLSFILVAIASCLVGLCYAELAAMIPIAGSVYSYSYAIFGEFVAWIIGWDLILEYVVSNVAVAVGFSDYLRTQIAAFGFTLPNRWASPVWANGHWTGAYFNIPGFLIVFLLTLLLIRGMRATAAANSLMVVVKIGAILAFLVVGGMLIRPINWRPFAPSGFYGVISGAAMLFFLYIGFDSVSTAAEECRTPQRDLPVGIVASSIICMILYVAVALVLLGMMRYTTFAVGEPAGAPVVYALKQAGANPFIQPIIIVGALMGMISSLLVFQYGQTRIWYAMSRDGLLPRLFSVVHPKSRTPYWSTWIACAAVGIPAGLIDIGDAADLGNIGAFLPFVLVSLGVIILRRRQPNRARPFRVPLVPWLPLLSVVLCIGLMTGLLVMTWISFMIWLALGVFIYFFYARNHSEFAKTTKILGEE